MPFSLGSFWAELRRRRVGRVAAAYVVVAWLIVQVAVNTFPYLELPRWTITLVIALAALGFPIALVLGWAFDLTPTGVRRAEATEEADSRGPPADPPATATTAAAAGRGQSTRLIVLPFRMLREDPEVEFLTFSLPDAITASLSGLRWLVVRSNLAAVPFGGDHQDLRAIAAHAEVDVVLTGTVLRSGERLRVTCQLTEAADGRLIWSQSSQVTTGDLFELQDQLSRRIVESLSIPLSSRERQILRRDVSESAEAYEFYLRANQLAYEVGHWGTARDLYLRSVSADPSYAPAWARLARCQRLLAKWTHDEVERQRLQAEAEASFQRALQLNPDLPLAHSLYAQLEVDLGRAREAMVRLLTRAHASGGDADLFAGLVHTCRFCGLLDASLAAHERARSLDPVATTSVAHTYYMRGEYELILNETYGDIGYIAPLALASLGRTSEALERLRESERTQGGSQITPYLVSLRALLEGKPEESLAAMEQALVGLRDGEALFYLVRQLSRIGEPGRAIVQLEKAIDLGFCCVPPLRHDPWLEPLRSDPRFAGILHRAERLQAVAREAFVSAGGEEVLPTHSLRSAPA